MRCVLATSASTLRPASSKLLHRGRCYTISPRIRQQTPCLTQYHPHCPGTLFETSTIIKRAMNTAIPGTATAPSPSTSRFLWVDLEMTGLNEQIHTIIEMAAIITDGYFTPLASYQAIIFQPEAAFQHMDDFVTQMHTKNGLLAAIPTKGIPLATAEAALTALIDEHWPQASGTDVWRKAILCGNSIGNDRRFILKYCPILASRLHYRMIDVSSFKEVFRARYNKEYKKKVNDKIGEQEHRATDDIQHSIEELKHYMTFINLP